MRGPLAPDSPVPGDKEGVDKSEEKAEDDACSYPLQSGKSPHNGFDMFVGDPHESSSVRRHSELEIGKQMRSTHAHRPGSNVNVPRADLVLLSEKSESCHN